MLYNLFTHSVDMVLIYTRDYYKRYQFLKLMKQNCIQNQNQIILLVTHQQTFIHQVSE